MSFLKIENIYKSFATTKAVRGISFEVEKGKIFGLLGPNGAGKTTTIRMINNIYIPDSGQILFENTPINSLIQEKIGYLPEERGLYKKIKVIDQILYFAALKGMDKKTAEIKADKWLEQLDAASWRNKKVQELSKGMQQKVQFIATIIHEPELLILDEPFSGFDPINTEQIKKVVIDLKNSGKTIILSTHIMHQAEQMCDDICLINKGQVVLSGGIREIKKRYGKDTVIVEFEGNNDFFDNIEGVRIIDKTHNRIELRIVDKTLTINELLRIAIDKVNIYKMELSEPSMNEIFINVTSENQD